jgi:hypothetical protein
LLDAAIAWGRHPLGRHVRLAMARAILTSRRSTRPHYEPLYDICPRTGAILEVFFSDRPLAQSFGASGPGWFWWSCQPGCLPDEPPTGPFLTSYAAYRQAFKENGPFEEGSLYEQSAFGIERKS